MAGDDEDDGEAGEVIVYELDDLTETQRELLELRLTTEGIIHQWEVDPDATEADPTDLIIGEVDEARVDALLDEVEFPDALEAVDEAAEETEVDDEALYEVMSHLYVAADRLKGDPSDLALAGEYFDAADAAAAQEDPPFGIDGEVWRRVRELAADLATDLEEDADDESDSDEAIAAKAQRLRDILFDYV